jgi:hypothetical protein
MGLVGVLAAAAAFAAEASPDEQDGEATVTGVAASAAAQGETQGQEDSTQTAESLVGTGQQGVVRLSMENAKDIFGVSDRNGTDSVDAYLTAFDVDTGVAWMPVFTDQVVELARTRSEGEALAEVAPADPDGPDSITVRISEYSQAQVDSALDEIRADAPGSGLMFVLRYNPALDAIEVEGRDEVSGAFGDSVGGVRVSYRIIDDIALDY